MRLERVAVPVIDPMGTTPPRSNEVFVVPIYPTKRHRALGIFCPLPAPSFSPSLLSTSSSLPALCSIHPAASRRAMGNGQPINKLFSATPLVPKARLLSFYLALSDCLSRSSIKFLPLSLSISLSLCACKSFAAATAAAMWSESLRGSMHIAQRETKSERARESGKGCYRMQFAPRLADSGCPARRAWK